jgi:hypothetical protein
VDLHLVAEDGDGSEIGFERQLVVTSPRSEIGNLLQIQVNGDAESITRAFSGQFRVGNDGSINYPTFSRIVVKARASPKLHG